MYINFKKGIQSRYIYMHIYMYIYIYIYMYVYIKLQIFLFLSEALSMLKNIIGLIIGSEKKNYLYFYF